MSGHKFPDVNESQAIALLAYVQASCKLSGASDSEGNELAITEISDRLSSSDSETIVSGWVCHGLISQIQLFFSWHNTSKIFIELTFFPQDVDNKLYSLESFNDWLKPLLLALNTSIYYVRYENVSWEFGDTREGSGVIFTNSQYAING